MPTAILSIGAVAPLYTLPNLDDQPVRRSAERGKRHQVLLFLPQIDQPARAYLRELAAEYQAITACDAAVQVVLSDPQADVDALKAAFDLPFPLLRDQEATVRRRYLPDDAQYGLFILDRYGALHAQWVLDAPPFPPLKDVLDWLQVVDMQCSL